MRLIAGAHGLHTIRSLYQVGSRARNSGWKENASVSLVAHAYGETCRVAAKKSARMKEKKSYNFNTLGENVNASALKYLITTVDYV